MMSQGFFVLNSQPQVKLISVLWWHLWLHSQASATAAEWWRGETDTQPPYSFCCRSLSLRSACKQNPLSCILLEISLLPPSHVLLVIRCPQNPLPQPSARG